MHGYGRATRSFQIDDVEDTSSLGIDDSTCELAGRHTTLTKMPITRLPSTSSRAGLDGHLRGKQQTQSMFFSRLSPDLRRQIYLSLFGSCRIHVEFDIGFSYHQRYLARYRSRAQRWRWWHRVCNEPSTFLPECGRRCDEQRDWCRHNEEESKRKKLMLRPASMKEHKIAGTSWLRSCWLGYLDSVEVLYSTNTFILDKNNAMTFRLSRLWPACHLSLITSLDVEYAVMDMVYPPIPDETYRALLILLSSAQFPKLRSLRIYLEFVPAYYLFGSDYVHRDEDEDVWFQPLEELARSRDNWKRLEVIIPESWMQCFLRSFQKRAIASTSSALRLVGGVEFEEFLKAIMTILL